MHLPTIVTIIRLATDIENPSQTLCDGLEYSPCLDQTHATNKHNEIIPIERTIPFANVDLL